MVALKQTSHLPVLPSFGVPSLLNFALHQPIDHIMFVYLSFFKALSDKPKRLKRNVTLYLMLPILKPASACFFRESHDRCIGPYKQPMSDGLADCST